MARILTESSSGCRKSVVRGLGLRAQDVGFTFFIFVTSGPMFFSLSLAFDPSHNLLWWHATVHNQKDLQAIQARDVCCCLINVRPPPRLPPHAPRPAPRHLQAPRAAWLSGRRRSRIGPSSSPARMSTHFISSPTRQTAAADVFFFLGHAAEKDCWRRVNK